MDGFEAWLEDVDNNPRRKLELMERFLTFKRTATGTVVYSMESPYGTIATVTYEHDEAFTEWMADIYRNEVVTTGGW